MPRFPHPPQTITFAEQLAGFRIIPVRNDKVNILVVDTEDYDRAMQHTWSISDRSSGHTTVSYTASTNTHTPGKTMQIGPVLLGPIPTGMVVIHLNKNGLDNRQSNLRIVTKQVRAAYSNAVQDTKSGYKGVYVKGANMNRYGAAINANGTKQYLGTFDTPEEAHTAYCKAAKEVYGDWFNPGTIKAAA